MKICEKIQEIKALVQPYDALLSRFNHDVSAKDSELQKPSSALLEVLLVEDDQLQREFIAAIIELKSPKKIKVVMAADGEEATLFLFKSLS